MKTSRVGIDARLMYQTGVGTYLRNLLRHLPQYLPPDMEIYWYVLSADRRRMKTQDNRIIIRETDVRWHSFSEQTHFLAQLLSDRLDLMHFPYFSYPVLYNRPYIATVHDMTPLLFKTGRASTHHPFWYEIKHHVFSWMLQRQISKARTIITPTHTVKDQVTARFGMHHATKTVPIYEGVDGDLLQAGTSAPEARAHAQSDIPAADHDYYLYVGNFYPHKNVERLLEAFSRIQQKTSRHLYLVGPQNIFSERLTEMVDQRGLERVHFLHGVASVQLAALYLDAYALVNPSLSEGFGLPLIEAAYFGCPIIASDIPVFSELLPGQFVSFSPESEDSIATALLAPVQSADRSFLKRFSFDSMTRDTIAQYRAQLSIHS